MHIILLDWTRMGRSYCLSGAVVEEDLGRVIRPLLRRGAEEPVRNVGWSAFLLDGHLRWEMFELIDPCPATLQPPHTEDVWVKALKPLKRFATMAQRRQILATTCIPPGQPLFGADLCFTRATAYLPPDQGTRSLATVVVTGADIRFSAAARSGAPEPELRVELPSAGLAGKQLPVKDHHLLRRAEASGQTLADQVQAMQQAVLQMGPRVAVRLGLTRPFQATAGRGPGFCWLMADGFFSHAEPLS
jgi:hypothetical protein